MLRVNNLKKSFLKPSGERLLVLRNLSFTLEAGEMIAITGASGAGKSTLLHVLGGLEERDEGEIKLNDFDIAKATSGELATYRRRDVGFVFQFHHLLTDLNALENVLMPLLIRRISKQQAMQKAMLMIERINLTERMTHPIGQLSGGEQQRIAVARALVTEPFLVLADEPTGNLDSQTGAEIGALLKSYSEEKNAIVLIATHNEHMAGICNRVLHLKNGVIETF
jgi:lipoprotein-releasing system ATP-binding protein